MSNKKTSWSNFKLRAQLLRIWFMKNILVWIQIFLIICVVLILTGNITANTPILGLLVYPLFKPLIDEISEMVATKNIDNLMDFFAVSISLLTSIGVALIKVRNIAQSDIKSDSLKIALVKAHLYFNSDGKLVKKTEAMVGYDLDGDGLIDGKTPEPTKGLFSGIITAVDELKVIAAADFSGTDEEDIHNYNKALQEARLKDNAEAVKVIDETIKGGMLEATKDIFNKEIDKKITENINNKEKTIKEKISIDAALLSLKKIVGKIFKKKETSKGSDDAEVITNNIEIDAEVKEEKKEEPKSILDMVNKTSTPKIIEPKKVKIPADDISNYLAQFRK